MDTITWYIIVTERDNTQNEREEKELTKKEFMEMVKALGNDVDTWEDKKGMIHLTVHDFEGFDEDWNEVKSEYEEDKVEDFLDTLEEEAIEAYGDFYRYCEFKEFSVKIGFESMDI